MFYPFSRAVLFLVSICGWGAAFFGGWIALRGVLFYDWDPVLMGTGGGIALGGLLVTVLTIGAQAQIVTARDTAAMRAAFERGLPRNGPVSVGPMPGPPKLRGLSTPPADAITAAPRPEPTLSRKR